MKKRRGFKGLITLALVTVMMLTLVACGGSGGSAGSYSNTVYVPPVSPYVTMVKDATHSSYGVTYGKAFDAFFADPEWSYFKASTGEHVVEFKGEFSYNDAPADAKIQFVLDLDEGTFSAYHLSIDGVDQNKLMLATLIQKVFESY